MSSGNLDSRKTKSKEPAIFKNTIQFISAILVLGITLVSCEQNKLISITVVDKATRQHFDSVYIAIKAGKKGDYTKTNKSGYTNSAGKFENI